MNDKQRNYPRGDRAALHLFSAGKCYWPGCPEPLLREVEGKFKLALEIAHIRAANPKGERYVNISEEERKSFKNLIFLCTAHHKTVDESGAEKEYPIKLLEKWKHDREQGKLEQLNGLREVTENKLVEMISTAMQQRDAEITETVKRLERSDSAAASLVRELRDELETTRQSNHFINPDSVQILSESAHKLTNLEDKAQILNIAADKLGNIEDNAETLRQAGTYFNTFIQNAEILQQALKQLSHLPGYADSINEAAHNLTRAAQRAEDSGFR